MLGPPTLRQTETIRKQRSEDEDEFWQLAPKWLARAEAADAGPSLFPNAPYSPASKLPTELRWLAQRIDAANAELMLGLVRALDKQMNNTSVILLLEVGKKRLLFPGDAQYENWMYALSKPWVQKLLKGVDVYKVGHHGSLNATPKTMLGLFAKKKSRLGAGRKPMYSLLSTKPGVHGTESKRTEVPRTSLVNELRRETQFHSTEKFPVGTKSMSSRWRCAGVSVVEPSAYCFAISRP